MLSYDARLPLVIDIETTVKNTDTGNNKASPHSRLNRVVLAGKLSHGGKSYDPVMTVTNKVNELFSAEERPFNRLLVGHNIKFDLLYLAKTRPTNAVFGVHVCVWDTMLVEYLLTGQQTKFASLDELSTKYGGTLKDNRIKELWDAGVQTEDIDEAILVPYLKHDLEQTYLVYKRQRAIAEAMTGMMKLIERQNAMLLVTTLMEYHGMHIAVDEFIAMSSKTLDALSLAEEAMYKAVDAPIEINLASPAQLTAYLYGGTVSRIEDVPVLDKAGEKQYYKSGRKAGMLRTKKDKVSYVLKTLVSPNVLSTISKGTDEETLENIIKLEKDSEVRSFVRKVLNYRTLAKEYNTYYEGLRTYIWDHDDCIHPNLNICATNTGRLSSSSPNLQNIPAYEE